nr:hypothetical protein [uncultured Intestinibacter sp.]
MERWQKMNVYFSLVGLIIFIVCIIFIKTLPILLLAAAFALGITFNCFKTIYKKIPPPGYEEVENKNKNISKNKKKKAKKR